MKLIECKNQEQIVNALLIRKENNTEVINKSDVNSILFLIEKNLETIGTVTAHSRETSLIIDDIMCDSDNDKIDTLVLLEEYGKRMQFEYITCICSVEDSYTYRELSYKSNGDIFIEDEKLKIKMSKQL